VGPELDYDQLFPGRFLKSGEFLGKDVTLTVADIRIEALPQEKGGDRDRGIVTFRETKKELVLNRTNGECFKAMFGRKAKPDWIGKRVTLWPAPFTDSFTGEVGTAIRVRGSPDIGADMQIEVRLPRKKPIRMTMKLTARRNGKPAPVPADDPAATDPAMDPSVDVGEPGQTG
jgi:hypothetical protein